MKNLTKKILIILVSLILCITVVPMTPINRSEVEATDITVDDTTLESKNDNTDCFVMLEGTNINQNETELTITLTFYVKNLIAYVYGRSTPSSTNYYFAEFTGEMITSETGKSLTSGQPTIDVSDSRRNWCLGISS